LRQFYQESAFAAMIFTKFRQIRQETPIKDWQLLALQLALSKQHPAT
jgi:hypothetical protein